MNTISEATNRPLAFQETQLLPLLTAEMVSRRGAAAARFGARPHSESSPERAHKHLPFKETQLLPALTPEILAGRDGARRFLAPGSTEEGAGQVSAATIELCANRALLSAWWVPLLG